MILMNLKMKKKQYQQMIETQSLLPIENQIIIK